MQRADDGDDLLWVWAQAVKVELPGSGNRALCVTS